MFCSTCGIKLVNGSKFCTNCGAKIVYINESKLENNTPEENTHPSNGNDHQSKSFQEQIKGTFLNATGKINSMVGEKGNIDLNLRDVFSAVFKKHTKEEGELIFITGTKQTTPEEHEISSSWPKPWLFSRVLLFFVITYALLYISTFSFQNINALPGLIIIGSFAVPVSLLIFFWETNAPRNISFYETLKMLFIGGASSLVVTLFLFSFLPVNQLDYVGAVIVGVVEEVGKLVIVIYFVYKLNPKYILNGLLIGAAVGAGFAAFESAGYAFRFGLTHGDATMLDVIFLRAWTGIGTHTIWAAISGAALVYVKGNENLSSNHCFNTNFLKLFAVPVIIHAVWDMPLHLLNKFYFLPIVLIIIGWIFIFTLINAGLKQIVRLNRQVEQIATGEGGQN
ncbi:PrsW family intramembrane metalloprotease [Ornithinibacillus halotolerans]|uniref:Membrane protein n=1 Tax=Ornithinibacillus halotolerans TaxID=1274357 RepID=A0A916RWI0_9BACI|nr:PrsW family intramembrane metalloprotease [Ornithinibacillus halotolerans]GGA72522.1 membrane protein [Ornithinibacillus halotolerans]